MASAHWPLFGLRVSTPRLELRYPDDHDVDQLASLALRGVHDPASTPFRFPWTDAPPEDLGRNCLQFFWRTRAETSPTDWHLPMAVAVDGELVGVQGAVAKDFPVLRTAETGSWLGLAHQGRGIGTEMRAAILHVLFAGLGAEEATTGAWRDNGASRRVTAKFPYEPNGEERGLRRGVADVMVHLRMSRSAWEPTRRDDITIHGLDPCLRLLGLG